jgi:enamine deaminase RidA (YjgF/YER057c/UK114 family)
MLIEQKLAEMGLELPPSSPPLGNYVRAVRNSDLLFVSGHLPEVDGRQVHPGKLGREVTTEQGYEAARQATINLLGTVRETLGDLDRVKRVVKLLGMVNSTDDFTSQTEVVNGASDFLVEVFGERALHARSAVGMNQLPRNNCVEVEAILEVS